MTSEEYHDALNALIVEVVTKLLRGDSHTDGGMDWEDAERFLTLAVSYLKINPHITSYPDGRLKMAVEVSGEDGILLRSDPTVDVAEYLANCLNGERNYGGKPDAYIADYRSALERVSEVLK